MEYKVKKEYIQPEIVCYELAPLMVAQGSVVFVGEEEVEEDEYLSAEYRGSWEIIWDEL